MIEPQPARTTEPEAYDLPIRMLGTGASDPTKEVGKGVTVTRQVLGRYRITFQESPGRYIGPKGYSFQGTTPVNLAGCTIVMGDFSAASGGTKAFIDVSVYSGSTTPALRELAATERLHLCLEFAYGNV